MQPTHPLHHTNHEPSDACNNLFEALEELVLSITDDTLPDDDIPFVIASLRGRGLYVSKVTSGDKDEAFNVLALMSLAAPDAVGFASYAWMATGAAGKTCDRLALRPSQHPEREECATIVVADGDVLLQGTASVSRRGDNRPSVAKFHRSCALLAEAVGVIPELMRAGYMLSKELA